MSINTEALPLLRLLHLVSPSLPVGAFTYSQGLEWAVEAGWVSDEQSVQAWLEDLLLEVLPGSDIVLLGRMHQACCAGDQEALEKWCRMLIALRETSELRLEEANRGRAMASLLVNLEIPYAAHWRETLERSQLAGYALVAAHWQIDPEPAALGWTWGWLENQLLAAVKIIPLGQTAGQRILHRLTPLIPDAVQRGLSMEDAAIGASAPALAIASSRHQTQYTRLFRS